MLDFAHVRTKNTSISELCAGLSRPDLHPLTNEMADTMLNLVAGCVDADVNFVPEDPAAYDKYAATPEEVHTPWTLGHVIVHTTASAEECAFLAAELARGVSERSGRSRFEFPCSSITTIAQCRERLEESRRMRLTSLDLWPDVPYLETTYRFRPDGLAFGAVSLFVYGLYHDDSHLGQIAEIVRQAKAARG